MSKQNLDLKLKEIQLGQFDYDLPSERIAEKALAKRDQSKLLYYQKGKIEHRRFFELDNILNPETSLFFNDTKVIPARIHFHKSTGAKIEVFLTEPILPSRDYATTMSSHYECSWKVMIGNLKKWKNGDTLNLETESGHYLKATLIDRKRMIVQLHWTGDLSFSEILQETGKVPLPPYIKREPVKSDTERYQTVYSKEEGAVAAPTAGLHFTDKILNKLKEKGIKSHFLTLHVSAGTFQPVKSDRVIDHPMHMELVSIKKEIVKALINSKSRIAVGTTSMRTLESLYWYGVKLKNRSTEFNISTLYPYEFAEADLPTLKDSMNIILEYMESQNLEILQGQTEIFIVPGYQFRVCNGLITNFHMPKSTLIMLVNAFIGNDWKNVYQEALENDYRFLSYGDSSLLIP